MKIYKSFWAYALGLPAVIVLLDQLSKKWATDLFDLPFNICEINPYIGQEGYLKEFSPIIDWAMTCNQGVSFGMLSGDSPAKRWGLTVFAGLMVIAILYVLLKTSEKFTRIGLGLIIGGAIGNGIDRFMHGSVTDFISAEGLLPFFPWVFNIADSAITIGVMFIALDIFLEWRREKKKQA
ncbi:MAG: signal peptidase II [Hellea sp.]|nr:signal peptidase II [Hellea sp.]